MNPWTTGALPFWRRGRWLAVGFVLALSAAGAGVAALYWHKPPPAPPDVDLTQADPAVKTVIESAQEAARREPRSDAVWGRLGMVLAAHGFWAESAPCFAEAERLHPDEPRWPYFRGVALQAAEADAALPALRRAVALAPPTADAPRLRLADALLGQGRSEEAEKLFRQVLAHDSNNASAHLGLGRLACERNEWADGLAHLDRAAASPLTAKRAHTLLAAVQQRRGEPAAAEYERRLADDLAADPDAPDPFLDELEQFQVGKQARLIRAGKLLQQDRVEEAAALLQELVRDYPDSASAWLGLGRAEVRRQRYRAAEQALNAAARLDPARVEVQFYLGVALFQQGRTGDAADYFQRAVQLRPDDAVAQYNLGQCLKARGDRAGAVAAFTEAVRCKPHYAQAHAALGELLALDGRLDQAREHLRLAVDLDPTDAQAKALLAKYSR